MTASKSPHQCGLYLCKLKMLLATMIVGWNDTLAGDSCLGDLTPISGLYEQLSEAKRISKVLTPADSNIFQSSHIPGVTSS